MPISLPQLDDRTYDSLVEEARGLIPAYAPEWTNHNASDPGITLIELFAWLSEILIYRLDRVTDANMRVFLRLLNVPDWTPASGTTLEEQVRATLLELRRPHRCVTMQDFEVLARRADPAVARAHAVARRNLELADASRYTDQPSHVSLILLPSDPALLKKVRADLDPRRLITTVLHVVPARYISAGIQVSLVLTSDARPASVVEAGIQALRAFADPHTGGPDRRGWPFGRNLYVSDVYRILDGIPGVDYVTKTLDKDRKPLDELLVADAARMERKGEQLVSVNLYEDELLKLDTIALAIAAQEGKP